MAAQRDLNGPNKDKNKDISPPKTVQQNGKENQEPLPEQFFTPMGKEDTPPDPTKWYEMFQKLAKAVESLQTKLDRPTGTQAPNSIFTEDWKSYVDSGLEILGSESADSDYRLNLMANIIIRQDESIQDLEGKLSMVRGQQARSNLIIRGILEDKDETRTQCQEKIADFFKTQMGITEEIEIVDIYRRGPPFLADRPICVTLKHPNDKGIIYKKASNLKGKKNARKQLFKVDDDLNEQQTATRMYYRDLIKENNEQEEEQKKVQLKMNRGKIFVNNKELQPKVSPPVVADILQMKPEKMQQVKAIKLVEGNDHVEKNSEFFSFALKTKTVQEVQDAYYKMRLKFADATHVSCGYRLVDPMGPYQQEAIDDMESGQGRAILSAIKEKGEKEICVFVIRYYGGIKLGKRRFDIAKDLTFSAIRNLKTARAKRQNRLQRNITHSSVKSVLSDVSQISLADTIDSSQDDLTEVGT